MLIVWVLVGSVLGISAMVALNAWLGLSQPARLSGLDDAVQRLEADAAGFDAAEGTVAPDGRSALVMSAAGDIIAMLVARGSDFVIRYLDKGSVGAVEDAGDGTLTVRLNDFAFAPARLNLDTPQAARYWADKLDALQD
jgi:hypothetical protein